MSTRIAFAGVIVAALVVGFMLGAQAEDDAIERSWVAAAQNIIGLDFNEAEQDSLLDDLNDYLDNYKKMRTVTIPNNVPPSLQFNALPLGVELQSERRALVSTKATVNDVPEDLDALAFYSVGDLSALIRGKKLTSVQLTEMYLARLEKYGPQLECVVTLTKERALEQARRADAEIAEGHYRGPLHGIPYGAKDLLAVKGYPTTWGATPYKDQAFDEDATVVRNLEEAGAVLVVKLTLGALAWGDVWFGGMTRNPWNLEQGSSGSSAGSASATSAGLVAFAIGTETWGSIVSPSTRCGTTGLRPTYGRVSRAGAMALSWSMDKIGPICRTVEDCALVFDAIRGPDGVDQSVIDAPFNYDASADVTRLRVGYIKEMFEEASSFKATDDATLAKLQELGIELVPVNLPDYPVEALTHILTVEAAAAFDDFTRSNQDDLLVRQIKNAWPNVFRAARFVPAVEYIQANRIRHMIIQEMEKMPVDVYITPSYGGNNLLLTNLTGHPSVVLPNGFNDEGSPLSITFMGRLFGEADVLAVAKAYQDATDFHTKHPSAFQ